MEKKVDIERAVKNTLAESLDIDISKIKSNSLLIEELSIDSFGFAELSFAVQEKFKLEISNEDAQKMKTVNDIVNYISNNFKGE